jgi:predicted RNA-binding protein with PUA-like domain
MARWLFKEEPEHYSFADLQRDRTTIWDGVSNNLAQKNLRQVKAGDRVLFYHTGKEKAVVGEMRVRIGPHPAEEGSKQVVIEVEVVGPLARPVSLATIKDDPLLKDWDLVRLPRLSVMPVSTEQWRRIVELSKLPD